MAVYYLFDDRRRAEANASGRNYWFCYITELLCRLGVSAAALRSADMRFKPGDVMFVGPGELSETDKAALSGTDGLILFGFSSENADVLFGIESTGVVEQPDPFSITGMFRMAQSGYLPVPAYDSALPVVSHIRTVLPRGADILAYIGENPGLLRCGSAYYFTFDLTQTLWTCSAGKPVTEGRNGFSIGRVPDSRIVPPDYDTRIAFCDWYLYIIQTILAGAGYPMLHRLPPSDDGSVPDLLLYFGGDDDATDGAMNLEASRVMHERGLPYHINLMPGANCNFVTTREEFDIIRSRGHELAFHYDFAYRQGKEQFTAEGFAAQIKLFRDAFGTLPVCNVGHCLTHHGWAERCRYQAALGIKGDNSRFGEVDPADVNAFGLYGFAFGTAFPFFAYDDFEHGNVRLDIAELVINYYEPRLRENDFDALRQIRLCIDDAARFGRTINFFLHPHYITGTYGSAGPVLAAVDEALSHAAKRGYSVCTYGPDRLCLWWHSRAASSVTGKGGRFTVDAAAPVIIRIPASGAGSVTVNGTKAGFAKKKIDGLDWLLLPVGEGISEVNVTY